MAKKIYAVEMYKNDAIDGYRLYDTMEKATNYIAQSKEYIQAKNVIDSDKFNYEYVNYFGDTITLCVRDANLY